MTRRPTPASAYPAPIRAGAPVVRLHGGIFRGTTLRRVDEPVLHAAQARELIARWEASGWGVEHVELRDADGGARGSYSTWDGWRA